METSPLPFQNAIPRGSGEVRDQFGGGGVFAVSLRIQVCPKNPGLPPFYPILRMECFDHLSYSREVSGSL